MRPARSARRGPSAVSLTRAGGCSARPSSGPPTAVRNRPRPAATEWPGPPRTRWLGEALSQAEQMGEVHRVSPPLWGLAEDARCRGDFGAAIELCDRGYAASADAGDAAYLFPFLLTGIRAQLAAGSADGAEDW